MKREKSYYKSIFSLVCVFSYPVQIMEQWIKKKLSLLNVYVGCRYAPLILFMVSRKTERTQKNERNNSYIIAYKLHINEHHSQHTHTKFVLDAHTFSYIQHPSIYRIDSSGLEFFFVCLSTNPSFYHTCTHFKRGQHCFYCLHIGDADADVILCNCHLSLCFFCTHRSV